MLPSRALFYPTIDITDEDWLKTAYLFWDELSTIVPESLSGRAYKNITTQFLEEEGFLTPVLVNPDSEIVKGLVKTVKRYARTKEGKLCLGQRTNSFSSNPYSDLGSEFYLHHEKLPLEIQELVGSRIDEDGWISVSDNFSSFYMTLLADEIANERAMSLLTSSPCLEKLTTRFNKDSVDWSCHRNDSPEIGQRMLIKMIIDGIRISPLVSFGELSAFKQHHRDELNRFRAGYSELSDMKLPIEATIDVIKHIVKECYQCKVLQPLEDLKASLQGSRISFVTTAASLACTGITVIDSFPALSNPIRFAIGAGLFFSIKGINEYWERRKIMQSSSVSYLLSIDNELV